MEYPRCADLHHAIVKPIVTQAPVVTQIQPKYRTWMFVGTTSKSLGHFGTFSSFAIAEFADEDVQIPNSPNETSSSHEHPTALQMIGKVRQRY